MPQVHGLRPADAQKKTPAKTVMVEIIIIIIVIIIDTYSAVSTNCLKCCTIMWSKL